MAFYVFVNSKLRIDVKKLIGRFVAKINDEVIMDYTDSDEEITVQFALITKRSNVLELTAMNVGDSKFDVAFEVQIESKDMMTLLDGPYRLTNKNPKKPTSMQTVNIIVKTVEPMKELSSHKFDPNA